MNFRSCSTRLSNLLFIFFSCEMHVLNNNNIIAFSLNDWRSNCQNHERICGQNKWSGNFILILNFEIDHFSCFVSFCLSFNANLNEICNIVCWSVSWRHCLIFVYSYCIIVNYLNIRCHCIITFNLFKCLACCTHMVIIIIQLLTWSIFINWQCHTDERVRERENKNVLNDEFESS